MSDSITLTGQTNGTVTLTGGSGGTLIFQGVSQGIKGDKGDQGDPATNLVTSVAGRQGAVVLDKSDVGLSNADDTSDANKPISTATQAALDTKATTTALDAHANNTSNPHSVTKAQVGLGNAENTSDADKPVSTAQQTALDGKATLINIPQSSVPYRTTAGNGEPNTSYTVSGGTTPGTLAARDGAGALSAAVATQAYHVVRKDQMDTADALKANFPTVNNTLPVRNASGGQDQLVYGSAPVSATIAFRTTGGALGVGTATDATHAIPLAQLNSRIQQGTGFPEGVVTANVGTIYIDTAVTNGIAIWYKKTGTGSTGYIPLNISGTAPASASATGIAGQTAYDANYYYICTATNTWKRVAIASW